MTLFIWVQHLFGLGHARRMARVAAACGAAGLRVTVAAGGPGGAELFAGLGNVGAIQLPPLKTRDHQYTGLLTQDGTPPDEGFWAQRRAALLEALERTGPDVVMVELFPFGRRKFADEVLALIAAARAAPNGPRIVSSVRDIVEPKGDERKTREMAGWLKDHFDAVLVHGQEDLIPLTDSAPFAAGAGVPLHYTGYVAPETTSEHVPPAEKSGVVVSAGSGASGAALLATAAEAAARHATDRAPWHLFVPGGVDAPAGAGPHVHIHPFTEEFTSYLARAEVSVGEAGYNTTAEALAYGARPVLVPYAEAAQTEQTVRAKAFARARLAAYLPAKDLNPMMMLSTVEAARTLPAPAALNLSGAATAAKVLKGLRGRAEAS